MISLRSIFCFALLSIAALSASAQSLQTYIIDPVHSGISFKVKHFFTHVPGQFAQFEGQIQLDPADLTQSKVEATIQAGSINTFNSDRDAHLNSGDFFDSETHPQIHFVSTEWTKKSDDVYEVRGDLTMLGKTHPITVQAKLLGFGVGGNDARITGFDVTGTLDRTVWGIDYGVGMIGKDVEFEINIQARLSTE